MQLLPSVFSDVKVAFLYDHICQCLSKSSLTFKWLFMLIFATVTESSPALKWLFFMLIFTTADPSLLLTSKWLFLYIDICHC